MRAFYYLTFLFVLVHSAVAESATLVLIEKESRRLTLLDGDNVIKSYSIALGDAPEGPKRCWGDEKTPEGHYHISERNPGSAFYKSLRISYPSKEDRQKAAFLKCPPGGDIMIHGLPNGRGWLGAFHRLIDWTDGCIAVTNSEMDEIWRLVPNGTAVQIKP